MKKIVDARLSTGETVIIDDPWFVTLVENGVLWMRAHAVDARAGAMEFAVNPRFIVWARVLEMP